MIPQESQADTITRQKRSWSIASGDVDIDVCPDYPGSEDKKKRQRTEARTSPEDTSSSVHSQSQGFSLEIATHQQPSLTASRHSLSADRSESAFNLKDTTTVTEEPPANMQSKATDMLRAVHTFQNARDFVINNPNFIYQCPSSPFVGDVTSLSAILSQITHAGEAVFVALSRRRMEGAEVDSSSREYPPRCHPQTRKNLRARIVNWFQRAQARRRWRMLWLLGPAGTGKSAIAQTIAEEAKIACRLGAALFLSRANHHDNPDHVIPTLAHQLARKLPEYKQIISHRLADDPTIVEKNRRTQFRELIIEPFRLLATQKPSIIREPLIIILDGLDECNGAGAQCELIELISNHARTFRESPLLWMIISRPEWHFSYLLTEPEYTASYQMEELIIDDKEAQADVLHVLDDRFTRIRRRYQHQLALTWPPKTALKNIAAVAKGMFAVSDTVIRFVEDEGVSDPFGRLEICLKFLNGSCAFAKEVHPLHALDLFYCEIMSKIPSDVLPTTKRILGVDLLFGSDSEPFGAVAQANLLHLSQAEYYSALKHLASVLSVPPASDAPFLFRIHFDHATFGDFLRDPNRSGKYAIDEAAVYLDVAVNSMRWIAVPQHATKNYATWIAEGDLWQVDLNSTRAFAMSRGLQTLWRLEGSSVQKLENALKYIDFRHLVFYDEPVFELIPWLISKVPSIAHLKKPGCCLQQPRIQKSAVWETYGAPYASLAGGPYWCEERAVVIVHIGSGKRTCELSLVTRPHDFMEKVHLSAGQKVEPIDVKLGDIASSLPSSELLSSVSCSISGNSAVI